MAEAPTVTLEPKIVEYCSFTGVPAEFNDFLPADSLEFKRWKASQAGPEALEKLTLRDKEGNEIEKKLPGGKMKKKAKAQIVIETNTRNKKKMITTISGLELFNIKLADASKICGKKFACGCSVTKNAAGSDQIDMQGDFKDALVDLVLRQYGTSHGIGKDAIYYIDPESKTKKKKAYFADGSDSEDEDDVKGQEGSAA
mmetsp:Transcript_16966/g.29009  ORF Transcript_16966/g.29009 Transcript_16966/m.29009 type:complete len:199 (+) Transcript_16966:139-735(+)|eukprot:CAMPEP_0119107764 /NCGR_PEP_ID=MMETSP1180-20130426/11589_1 /TAXON_ID=3052 ORGANISM="Chlamydomonas cf sp, Strain CCMP681" /NCGR_SAMPLE_ID=MMETSP1180 /ASSEMBLY_ACC=CAM_ASM_000741 /LENGTH=198 /DNA_ID=CAMNT_0007093301 /DNA_START=111 /DNA_END=707 /DNA_ORIENTATION=+